MLEDTKNFNHKQNVILAWIISVNEAHLSGPTAYYKLKDGVALCKLINRLQPGSVPHISTSQMAFKQRENICNFLNSVRRYGLAEVDLFKPSDVFQDSGMRKVFTTIEVIAMLAKKKGFNGPQLNHTLKKRKKVSFSDEESYIN